MHALSAVRSSETLILLDSSRSSLLPSGRVRKAPGLPAVAFQPDRQVLLSALATGQIQAWFQPKVSLATLCIKGVEALARWQHPTLGWMTPKAFLPWMSRHGLEEALLMHILNEVLSVQKGWRVQGLDLAVSINLPTHLLTNAQLPDQLLACVQSHQGLASALTFELLESTNTTTVDALYYGASRLVAMGFGLAQDDFGIGYSSMQRLIALPFTELKLDRSFVQGASRDKRLGAAVLASIQVGQSLGLLVTAEGVETRQDLAFLRQAACNEAQGYLFSKPLPAAELQNWLLSRSTTRLPNWYCCRSGLAREGNRIF